MPKRYGKSCAESEIRTLKCRMRVLTTGLLGVGTYCEDKIFKYFCFIVLVILNLCGDFRFLYFADIVRPSYRSFFPLSEGSTPGHWYIRLLSAISYHLFQLLHY